MLAVEKLAATETGRRKQLKEMLECQSRGTGGA